jgi:hypothetical protein
LLPTVWITDAVTRGSAASAALKRHKPWTLALVLSASITAPSRTTLSAMIRLPGRVSLSAYSKYSVVLALSASMNT